MALHKDLEMYCQALEISAVHSADVLAAGYTTLADLQGITADQLISDGVRRPIANKLANNFANANGLVAEVLGSEAEAQQAAEMKEAAKCSCLKNIKAITTPEYRFPFGICLHSAWWLSFGAIGALLRRGQYNDMPFTLLWGYSIFMWVVATVFLVCIGIKGVQKMGHTNALQSRRMFYAISLITVIYFALSCAGAHVLREPCTRARWHKQTGLDGHGWAWLACKRLGGLFGSRTSTTGSAGVICSFLSTVAFGGVAYHFRKQGQLQGTRPAYYNDMAGQAEAETPSNMDVPMIMVDPLDGNNAITA